MKHLLAGCGVVAFLAGMSCERHAWSETKVLHEQHGGHAPEHGAKAGEAAPADAHGENEHH